MPPANTITSNTDALSDPALDALRVSESRYRRLFETARDGILLLNADTAQVEDVNPYLINLLGYSHAEFLGKKLWEVGSFADIAQSKEMFDVLQTQGYVRYDDLPLKTKAGEKIPVEFVSNTYYCEGIKVIQCNIRDITERKADQAKTLRHTQLYAALSQCNKAVVYSTSEEALFPQVCRIAVQFGGMKMAWIGLVDSETSMVRPVASFGDDTGYLKDIDISVNAGSPFGRGPTGTAIRENQPFWCQDFLNGPVNLPWHERAACAGFAASASLPLHREGIVIGAFTLYSCEVDSFDGFAHDLLDEMATDISFALANFARESRRKQAELSLRESESKYKRLIENSPDIIYRFSVKRGGDYYSPTVTAILGHSVEHLYAHPFLWNESIHPEDRPVIARAIENYKAGSPFKVEYRIKNANGEWRWLYDRAIGSREENGDFIVEGLAMDITERKAAESRIAYLSRVHALLSGINSLIVRAHDRDELFREACRVAVEAGGFLMSLIAILDKNTMKLIPAASAGKNDELMAAIKGLMSSDSDAPKTMVARAIREKKAIVSNDSQNDSRILLGHKYAESGIHSMVILPLIVANEAVGVIALYAGEMEFFHEEEMQLLTELAGDIAHAVDHIGKQERLNYLAYYDVLTGLANRNLFHERVAQYMRSAANGGYKLAIGLIDLERFKNINDSLGRPSGDALLKQIAEWLTQKTGDINLLARIDADHFAIVMPEVRQEGDLAQLVEKTLEAFLQHPFHLNDAVFRIGVKVGIALFPDDGEDTDTLFRNAESALKKAKASGERYLFHTQKMTEAVAGKLTLENQLRQAIDNEEFVLYYQPKVNLVNGKVTSAEALIRWNDPRTGIVPPDRFIPMLEETGLIYEVGRWALKKAIEDYLRWRSAGLAAVRIAVNVSPLQLRNRNFIAEIEQKISIDAHAASGLELEITESLIMADIKHSIASLQAIRAMGITVAIDDFGTGFSSLSYLAKLPVDTLKIDRSFVIDMTAGPEGLALVSTIISLAHSLNLKVVAEGVETEEQSRLLRLLGCDEIQGYLFSKPVPGDLFETLFLASPSAG